MSKPYNALIIFLDSGREHRVEGIITDDILKKDVIFTEAGDIHDHGKQSNIRSLLLDTGERIEFPMDKTLIRWSAERHTAQIEDNKRRMERVAQASAAQKTAPMPSTPIAYRN